MRSTYPNVLVVSTGNNLYGTAFYEMIGPAGFANLTEMLGVDAYAIGEYDLITDRLNFLRFSDGNPSSSYVDSTRDFSKDPTYSARRADGNPRLFPYVSKTLGNNKTVAFFGVSSDRLPDYMAKDNISYSLSPPFKTKWDAFN